VGLHAAHRIAFQSSVFSSSVFSPTDFSTNEKLADSTETLSLLELEGGLFWLKTED
jgi:hypothetical protein